MESDAHLAKAPESEPSVPPPPFLTTAAVAILLTDLAGVVTYANPCAEALYGRPLIGLPLSGLASPYSRPDQDRAFRAVLNGGSFDSILEHLIKGERCVPVHLIMSPAYDEHNRLQGVSCFVHNVDDMMRFQRSLQHERDQFEAILESATDAFLMLDSNGHTALMNSMFGRLFNISRLSLVGRPIGEALRNLPHLPAKLVGLLLTLSQNAYHTEAGTFEIGTPKQRVLYWYTAPVYAPDGAPMGRLFTFRDVTIEREVDRMKTEFVSLVSHELRTPLSSVLGYAEYIIEGDAGPVSQEVLECVQTIHNNAERLTSLINDILDLTRIEAGRIELRPNWCDLGQVVRKVVEDVRPIINRRHQHILEYIPEGLPAVWIDSERIGQVLTNLISNASKYTPERGTIIIELGVVDDLEALPPGATDDVHVPCALVTVQDTGYGIDAEALPHIFERFYRSEDAQRRRIQGSGLGLTVAKSFVELHKGHIWLQSEVDKGTAVYFTLPISEGN